MTQTEKDAARYRWLIEGDNAWRVLRFSADSPDLCNGDRLERAIDAAMRRDEVMRDLIRAKMPTLQEAARRVLQKRKGCA
jgi:very-short-patch-repair endonuclease